MLVVWIALGTCVGLLHFGLISIEYRGMGGGSDGNNVREDITAVVGRGGEGIEQWWEGGLSNIEWGRMAVDTAWEDEANRCLSDG